jgi:imidazolonepropionase-like amidohydrolase
VLKLEPQNHVEDPVLKRRGRPNIWKVGIEMSAYQETKFIKDYAPGSKAVVELKNGNLCDVINGCYFEQGISLVIEHGMIKAIPGLGGQPADIKPDFTIDLMGKTVIPGLINTHCHLSTTSPSFLPGFRDLKPFKAYADKQIEKNMAECLIHGITNIRDAMAEDLRRTRLVRDRIAKGEIPGPRLLQAVVVGPPGGYFTEKYNLVMKWMRSLIGLRPLDHELEYAGVVEFPIDATDQQVRDAVDRAIDERGAEAIKIGEQIENMNNFKPDLTIMTQAQLNAVADQARKRGLKSTIHHVSLASFRRAVEAGVSSLAHVPYDGSLSEDDVKAFVSQGCINDPTMSVAYDTCYKILGEPTYDDPYMDKLTEFRNLVHAELVDEYWIPEFKQGAQDYYEKAKSGNMKIFGLMPMSAMYKYYAPWATTGARNLKLLFENGVRMTTGNDGGIPPCTLAMMQHEIDLLDLFLNQVTGEDIFGGADALRMATINGAICLGLEDRFGTIEAGKVADLAIVDGDPFKDPRVIGIRVAALFMDGQLVINDCGLKVERTGKK